MPSNNIRELRTKLKMTQQQLAKKIGTSQQQIQRIEAGIQTVRIDLADLICHALNATMYEIFPTTKLQINRALKRKQSTNPYLNTDLADQLSKEGFDVDIYLWKIQFELRGGASGSLWIESSDKERLRNKLDADTSEFGESSFFVFDSDNRRYAINLTNLLICQFISEFPDETDQLPNKDTNPCEVIIHLNNNKKPMKIWTVPDKVSLAVEPEYDGGAPLQDLFFEIEALSNNYTSIIDDDNNEIFIKKSEISMISVSLSRLGEVESL
jgi:transcriptional regulator with XRE-family HTH domain